MGRHAGNRGNNKGFRATEETWEIFLGHVATMSAIEASKLPGMPSAPAFVKKRRRDPAFAARASAAMASRRLENSGRKRITPAQWAGFLQAVGSCCVHSLCQQPGMPSEAAVYKRRANDPEFAAALASSYRVRVAIRLNAALHTRFPGGWVWASDLALARVQKAKERADIRLAAAEERNALREAKIESRAKRKVPAAKRNLPVAGETFRAQLSQNELYAVVTATIPRHLAPFSRDDIAADMILAILEGNLDVAECSKRAPEFQRQHWKMFGTFGSVSLDAPVAPGSKATIGDRLSGEASSFWG